MRERMCCLVLALVAGCTAAHGAEQGQSGTDVSQDPHCAEIVSERDVDANEVVNDTSPAQLAELASGTYSFHTSFYNGALPGRPDERPNHDVSGTLEVIVDVSRTRERQWRTPGETESRCSPTLHIPSSITLRTDDDTLSGMFSGTVVGQNSGGVWLQGTTRRDDLGGSYHESWYADNPSVELVLLLERDGTRLTTIRQGNLWMNDVNVPPGTKTVANIASW